MSVNKELTVCDSKLKARLVIVKNPFQPWNGRIIKEIPAGTKLRNELVGNANIGCEIYTSVNGRTVAIDDYVVMGGEIITVSPVVAKGGKSILGLVAMVALAVVSYGVAGVAGGTTAGMWGATIANSTMSVWGYAAAAAVMMVGGTLINRAFFQAPVTSTSKDSNTEQTYGWSGPTTMEGQNNAIAITYGKVLSAGQTIGKFVQTKNNKEYLNWLIACGEGELTFSNIMLNDNPISYYDGVQYYTRKGDNNPAVIPYFNDTYFTKSLGYQLMDDSERTDTAQGTGTQGLIVNLECSGGLYYAKDNGDLGEAWVQVKGEYRRAGTSAWTTWFNEKITGKQSSAIRKEYRKDDLTAGEYEVRVQVLDRSHSVTSNRASTRCYWSSLTSIVYDDFVYPGIALIGIRALATDQISGSPTIKFLKERAKVWVYCPPDDTHNNWHYEQKNANNPAWACYDMLHLASRLYNINTEQYEFEVRGVPASSLIYEQFLAWATFCNNKNYKVNIEIAQTGEMLDIINENIASIGHGMVLRFGTRYGCVWYCVKQPVQMFGMGNIISGTFSEDFLQTTDRANCVEITYIDADHDYSKETVTIYADDYDTSAVEQATQLTFNGITSYAQAFREGKYQLYSNKYQLRTVSFEANIDAIACTIGDVILVAHDVPQWTHSGRIHSVNTSTGEFRLPVELADTQGDIRLMYRTVKDNLYTINVAVTENGNGWCTVQGDLPSGNDNPQAGDVFDIGLTEKGSKPFIVTNITRAQDFTRTISGIEYVESVYSENYEIPPINYSEATNAKAKNVTGLNGSRMSYVNTEGMRTSRLYASWIAPSNGGRFTLLYSTDKSVWHVLQSGMSATEYEGDINVTGSIYIKVITTLGVSKSSGVIAGPIKVKADTLPPDVTRLDVEVISSGVRRYHWDFTYPTPNDIAGFRLKYVQGTVADWKNGYDVQDGLVTHQPYETTTVRQGSHVVMIKAVDNAGNESKNFATCAFDFGDPLEDNVLYKKDFSLNNWEECETNGQILADGYVHNAQTTQFWTSENAAHWTSADNEYWEENYKSFYLTTEFNAFASGYFYLLYEIDGISNLTYSVDNGIYVPYSTKIYVSPGQNIKIRFETPEGGNRTTLKSLIGVIDVPDREEHFRDISISTSGTELPIKTLAYETTAIHFDSLQVVGNQAVYPQIVSRTPCIIKAVNASGQAVACTMDITWQGFQNETYLPGVYDETKFDKSVYQ